MQACNSSTEEAEVEESSKFKAAWSSQEVLSQLSYTVRTQSQKKKKTSVSHYHTQLRNHLVVGGREGGVCTVLGIKLRILYLTRKALLTELSPWPIFIIFFKTGPHPSYG